ncbi:MAG TPA: Ig-like domain-containing protein, partial [Candidatus Dormibacteraeota bacterium]
MMDDPELQEIFTDPAHQEVVDLLKTARPTTPPLDPHFRSYLRAKLMDEARRSLPRPSSRPWYAFGFRGRTVALSMAAVATGFLVVLGVQVYLHKQPLPTTEGVAMILPPIANKTNVATAAEPIQLQFTGPVDKNAVADSVVIEPATSVTKQWVGSTLVIIPTHPLAPNTNYTVSLKPKAAAPAATTPAAIKPTPTVAPTPVVLHFSTVRAPIPPVTPPSFKTGNLTYGSDNRLDRSGTILNAVWTSGGQILATRPAGLAGPGALPTPSITPTPSGSSASGAGTDVWLLSPSGTPLHNLAPGSTMPSAPTSGNLFAAWTVRGGQASLDVRDLQGNLVGTVATVNGTPDRAPIWVGSDKLVYLDGGNLKLVDLHGNQLALPTLSKVQQGSIEASPSGTLLAVETVDGSVVVDLSMPAATVTQLVTGATGFEWSLKGDLAFLVQQSSNSNLYIAADGKRAVSIATSSNGQLWSDLNWAPDASSLLLASKPTGQTGISGMVAIDRDGSGLTPLGAKSLEYSQPEWSPRGDLVLFTRHDDATGGITFQVASLSTSGA